ncbi:MAG TPA: serine hydrolase [Pyrinomonadaceae bacterium]
MDKAISAIMTIFSRLRVVLIGFAVVASLNAQQATNSVFNATEPMISMRDGVRLYTQVYVPTPAREQLPILLLRTPYGSGELSSARIAASLPELTADGYIIVVQDIRGRFKSEGRFVMLRQPRDPVSGHPFNEYIEENIFKPLGMTHSTFVQPLPATLAPYMSNGYQIASDGPKPFEMVVAFPAGSLSSTATDMAQFMMAHLQDGQLGSARILRPETAQLMHSRQFALDPAANAMAYGFYEESRNGHRIIGHAGDTQYFHTDLHLILDAGIGFFVSHNSLGREQPLPRTTMWEMFLDRYFPSTSPAEPTFGSAKADAKAVSGTYMLSRRSETSFLKVATLLGEFTVSPVEDGMIEVAQLTGPNGKPKQWREVAPMTFLEENGHDKLVFKPDQNDRMQLILPYPFFVGQRVGLLENNKILLLVLGISLFLMLLTLVLWPVAWFVRRHYSHKLALTSMERRLRLAVRIVFVLDLLFMAAMTGLVVYASTHIEFLSDRGNTWFHLAQVIGVLGAIGTLVVLYNAIQTWRNREKRIWGKLQATLFVPVCLGFLWFAFAGNLLHFSSNY